MFALTPPSDGFYISHPSNAQKFLGNDVEQTSPHRFPLCPSVALVLHWQNKSLSNTELNISKKQAKPEERDQWGWLCSQLVFPFSSFPKSIQDIQEHWQKLQLTLPKLHCRLFRERRASVGLWVPSHEFNHSFESLPTRSWVLLLFCSSSDVIPCNSFECFR